MRRLVIFNLVGTAVVVTVAAGAILSNASVGATAIAVLFAQTFTMRCASNAGAS